MPFPRQKPRRQQLCHARASVVSAFADELFHGAGCTRRAVGRQFVDHTAEQGAMVCARIMYLCIVATLYEDDNHLH
jgi:hypothetical protein